MGRLVDEDDVIDIINFECRKWTGLSKTIEKEIKALPPAQAEEVLEIGKPHPLKGYEFCIFKDAYGDDWVEIRKYQDQRRGEQDG